MVARDLNFKVELSDNFSKQFGAILSTLGAAGKKVQEGNDKIKSSTDKTAKEILRIQRQAEVAEASLVENRFDRLISIQRTKHAHLLADAKENLDKAAAAERLNSARISKIRMDQKLFPETPFQRLLAQLGQVTAKFGTIPPGAGRAETAIRNLGSQAGSLALGGLAKAAASAGKAAHGISMFGEKVAKVASGISARDMLQFLGLQKVMRQLGQVGEVIWKSALKQSPELSAAVEKVKGKFNSLLTEVAGKVAPILATVFEFLSKHWDKFRFAVELGAAVIHDAFFALKGSIEFLAVGFLNGIKIMTIPLEKLHLVAKGTAQGMKEATDSMAAASQESFSKTGKAAEVLGNGLAGMGKAAKANIDFFSQSTKDATTSISKFLDAAKKGEERAKEFAAAADGAMEKAKSEMMVLDAAGKRMRDSSVAAMRDSASKRIAEINASQQDEINAFKLSAEAKVMTIEEQEQVVSNITQKYENDRLAIRKEVGKKGLEFLREQNEQRIAATATLFGGLAALTGQANMKDRQARLRHKAIAIAEAVANTSLAATKALASAPPPFNFLAMAGVIAAGLAQVNQIKEQKFAQGGIVGGGPSTGDHIPIRANAGEMVLTKEMQANLLEIARGGRHGGGTVVINVTAAPGMSRADSERVGAAAADGYTARLKEHARMNKDVLNRNITA